MAAFIGSPAKNFLSATLAAEGTAAVLETGALTPFADGRRDGPNGRPLTLGIRPEHLALAPDGLEVTVELVEPRGSETVAHGRAAWGDQALVVQLAGPPPAAERLTV